MKIKLTLLFLVLIGSISSKASEVEGLKNAGTFQFGGQMIVSFHYERSIFQFEKGSINLGIGAGLNEFGDSELELKPIYGIPFQMTGIIGVKALRARLSLMPTAYFDDGLSFVNINAWAGIRLVPYNGRVFFDFAYTPFLHTSLTEPDGHFARVPISFGVGVSF